MSLVILTRQGTLIIEGRKIELESTKDMTEAQIIQANKVVMEVLSHIGVEPKPLE